MPAGLSRVERLERLGRSRLYLCTPMRADLTETLTFADAVLAGGVDLLQLRHKGLEWREEQEALVALGDVARRRSALLSANDRADLTVTSGADVLHVGQDDLPPATARAILGPRAIIGLSLTSESQLAGCDPAVVDYVGLGPLFPTGTKADAARVLGEAAFTAIRRRLNCPVVAIGGITAVNTARAIAAGADGIAVVSAICAADDPRAAARALRAAVNAAREKSG